MSFSGPIVAIVIGVILLPPIAILCCMVVCRGRRSREGVSHTERVAHVPTVWVVVQQPCSAVVVGRHKQRVTEEV
jgi:hypothetical protein